MQLRAEAEATTDPMRRADLEWLANSYRLLAEHSREDEDNRGDMLPQAEIQQQQQVQQQQQAKLEPE
jgi:hypothetical protein